MSKSVKSMPVFNKFSKKIKINLLQGIPWLDMAIYTPLAALFGWSVVQYICSALQFEISLWWVLLLNFGLTVFFSIYLYNRWTAIFFSLTSVLTLGGYIYKLVSEEKLHETVALFIDAFYWFIGYFNEEAALEPEYARVAVIIFSLLFSLLSALFIVKRFNFTLLALFGTGTIITIWIYQYDYPTGFSQAPFAVHLLLMIVLLIRRGLEKNKEDGRFEQTPGAIFTAWAIPLCLIVILITGSVKPPASPVIWEWMDKKVIALMNKINSYYATMTAPEYFTFESTGFGRKDGRLGGRVKLDNRVVLDVNADRRVYLAGAIKDNYTGYSWTNTDKSIYPASENDILPAMKELAFAVLSTRDAGINPDDIMGFENIRITFRDMKTRTLFAPLNTVQITLPDDTGVLQNKNSDLFFNRLKWPGDSYNIGYYYFKTESPQIAEVLRKSKVGYYDELLETLDSQDNDFSSKDSSLNLDVHIGQVEESRFDFDKDEILKLKERAGEIYEKYLQLPPELPERIKELAQSITRDADTNYDKVKALEKYLSQLPYTLKPPITPGDRDFVDYFLFDLQQGYCTYYASALAVMTRTLGIPSRYVEGYLTPINQSGTDLYTITNQQAHAWVEVYFEGFGWVPFEPTGVYYYSYYGSGDNGQVLVDGRMFNDSYYDDYLEELDEELILQPVEVPRKKSLPLPVVLSLYIGLPLGLLLLVIVIVLLLNYRRSNHYFESLETANPREAIICYYRTMLRAAAYDQNGIEPGETPYQYGSRIGRLYNFGSVGFDEVTDLYVQARYGRKELSDEDRKKVMWAYRNMMDSMSEKHGKIKNFFTRYLMKKF